MKKQARQKLVEKDIKWGQVYTDKTDFLKEMYNDVIGPGSYFRFEGKDHGSGDEYYCIVGPARIHHPSAKFFAGVRKLPATFSAGGKYFDSMDGAAKYARETWGVPTPKDLKPYTSAQLYGISRKVKNWKEEREESGKDKKDGDKKMSSVFNYKKYVEAVNTKRHVTAMGEKRWKTRISDEDIYYWFDYDNIRAGSNSQWNELATEEPGLSQVAQDAEAEYNRQRGRIKKTYGKDDPYWYKLYIGYNVTMGAYIIPVGPYFSKIPFKSAIDKFYWGTWRRRHTTVSQLNKTMMNSLKKFAKHYGIQFTSEDLEFVAVTTTNETKPSGTKKKKKKSFGVNEFSMEQVVDEFPYLAEGSKFMLGNEGKKKIFSAHPFFQEMCKKMGKSSDEIVQDPKAARALYRLMEEKYKQAVADGTADELGMTKPPVYPDKATVKAGQQRPTSVQPLTKKEQETLTPEEQEAKIQKKGENSLSEAYHAIADKYPGFSTMVPQNFVNVTTDDLKEWRKKIGLAVDDETEEEVNEATEQDIAQDIGKFEVTEDVVEPTTESPEQAAEEFDIPDLEEVPDKPTKEHKLDSDLFGLDLDDDDVFSGAIDSLIKIAERLDNEGKCSASEEVHKVIRKYMKRG